MTHRPGWHGVGRSIPTRAKRPLAAAGLDWTVSMVPAEHNGPTRWSWLERSDNGRPVGQVLNSYEPQQNREAFGWMEEPGTRPVFAAELEEGSRIIVAAALDEEITIPGDAHPLRVHVIASTRHDSKGSVEVFPVVVRGGPEPLIIASGSRLYLLRGRHGRGGGVPPRGAIMLGARQYGEGIEALAKRLVATTFGDDDLASFIDWLKPSVERPEGEGEGPRDMKHRAAWMRYKTIEEGRAALQKGLETSSLSSVRGTAWGALLSVVHHDNYLRKADEHRNSVLTRDERKLLRILFEEPKLVGQAIQYLDPAALAIREAA